MHAHGLADGNVCHVLRRDEDVLLLLRRVGSVDLVVMLINPKQVTEQQGDAPSSAY
jgi:hypothetical protein